MTRHPAIIAAIGFSIVLALASGTDAAAPLDPSRHDLDRARWFAARADTFRTTSLLRDIDRNAGPATRAVLLRLVVDDAAPAPVIPTAVREERTWDAILRWTLGNPVPAVDDPEATILRAAATLDAGDPERARRLLADLDPPESMRAIALHLRILAADSDVGAAEAEERLARLDAHGPADQRLVDEAALRCGARALAREEDPTPWFDRLDRDGPAAAWATWLRALTAPESTRDEALDTWIATHPDHPGTAETRLRRAGRALAAGDDSTARLLHRTLEDLLTRRAEELAHVAADSVAMRAWSDALWRGVDVAFLTHSNDRWVQRTNDLHRALVLDDDVPRPGHLTITPPGALDDGTVDVADRREDARRRSDLTAATRVFDATRRAFEAAEAESRARADYRSRGFDRLQELEVERGSTSASLDSLYRATPEILSALRDVEDALLERIEGRTQRLIARANSQAAHARDLARWYGRGPMARRDPAPHPEVPKPSDHLDAEQELARSTAALLETFSDRSPEIVRQSFSEVFATRLARGTETAVARADSLDAFQSRLVADLSTSHPVDTALVAARAAHLEAAARRRDALERVEEHRLAVATRALSRERDVLEARREAVAYGAAVAATRLALSNDPSLRDEARTRWAALLDAGCDPRVRGDARYRWADLELVAAREDFQERMGSWLDEEGQGERAMAPLLDIDTALTLYRAILDDDPDFERRDLVLFHLGMLHADRGDPEADAYLTRLVDEHPSSPVIPEAQLRRGDLAFEAEDFAAALAPLRVAATADDPEIRAVALYELGWSAHATGREQEAIDTFDALLDLYASSDAPQSFDLADEARALYLRAVARAGGAPAFLASIERNGEREDAPALLADLSALLSSYALDAQAAAADRLYLDRYVTHPGALDAARRWIDTEARQGGVAAADAALLDVVDEFVPGGRWATAQDDTLESRGIAFAHDGLVGVTFRRHEAARAAGDENEWKATRALYVRLMDTWPKDPDVPRWNLLAGECALATRDHAGAFDHFAMAASDGGDVGNEAAWQTVATTDAWYRGSIPKNATVGADSLARRFVEQADAFRTRRPDAEGHADLAWRAVRLTLAHGWDAEVVDRAAAFEAEFADDPRHVDAARLRSEALYRAEDYLAASKAFENATTLAHAADRDSLAIALDGWIAHSFELHATSVETNDALDAAPLWRELADRWPEREAAAAALYRSGANYASSARDSMAIDSWRSLVTRYPQDGLAPDAHRNIARTLEDQSDHDGAARALVAFADAHPDAEDAADALLHAVDLRERLGDVTGRDALLDDYLQRYPEDLQTLQAVRETRARAALQADVDGAAMTAYLEFAASHPELAADDLLAQHAFRQADARWDDYLAMELSQPLEPSLVRKRDALTELLDGYREVAERGVSPWAQAATARIGEALFHLGDALIASERPEGLTGDDLLAYDEVLEQQAWTFHDRAEGALRELLRHHVAEEDAERDRWARHARGLLFPRIAQRFLHKPSFDYPVLETDEVARRVPSPTIEASVLQSEAR